MHNYTSLRLVHPGMTRTPTSASSPSTSSSLPYRTASSASTQTTPTSSPPTSPTGISFARSSKPEDFTKPFCDFLIHNPTVFHAANALGEDLKAAGYKKLTERGAWKLEKGGKYFFERNGSSLIAFAIGEEYEPGNGAAMIAAHIDVRGPVTIRDDLSDLLPGSHRKAKAHIYAPCKGWICSARCRSVCGRLEQHMVG